MGHGDRNRSPQPFPTWRPADWRVKGVLRLSIMSVFLQIIVIRKYNNVETIVGGKQVKTANRMNNSNAKPFDVALA